jgi:hypothetical protein
MDASASLSCTLAIQMKGLFPNENAMLYIAEHGYDRLSKPTEEKVVDSMAPQSTFNQ